MVALKRSAEEAYSNRIQTALKDTVWMMGCNNWYTRGVEGKVWNGMTYPWSQARFWYECLFPVWQDWEYTVSRLHPFSWGIRGMLTVPGRTIQAYCGQAEASRTLVPQLCGPGRRWTVRMGQKPPGFEACVPVGSQGSRFACHEDLGIGPLAEAAPKLSEQHQLRAPGVSV